jgi:hypothetical protein
VLGLFRPLEAYVRLFVVSLGLLCFVVILGCGLTFPSEFVCLPFVECDFQRDLHFGILVFRLKMFPSSLILVILTWPFLI